MSAPRYDPALSDRLQAPAEWVAITRSGKREVPSMAPFEAAQAITALERELRNMQRDLTVARNAQADVAMSASIKLAAARMVLSRLVDAPGVTSEIREAIHGACAALPAVHAKPPPGSTNPQKLVEHSTATVKRLERS